MKAIVVLLLCIVATVYAAAPRYVTLQKDMHLVFNKNRMTSRYRLEKSDSQMICEGNQNICADIDHLPESGGCTIEGFDYEGVAAWKCDVDLITGKYNVLATDVACEGRNDPNDPQSNPEYDNDVLVGSCRMFYKLALNPHYVAPRPIPPQPAPQPTKPTVTVIDEVRTTTVQPTIHTVLVGEQIAQAVHVQETGYTTVQIDDVMYTTKTIPPDDAVLGVVLVFVFLVVGVITGCRW